MKRLISLALLIFMLMGIASAASIETTGAASVALEPDIAQLSLGVRSFEADVTQAMANVNLRVEQIRAALAEMNISPDGIVAEDVYIYSNYDYDTGLNSGYNVTRQMRVTVSDISIVGNVIDAALSNGADELNSLSFSSSGQREAYDEAMALAVQDARKRAEIIAAAEGMTIVSLTSLAEGDNWGGGDYYYEATADAASGETELAVGSLEVRASITAVYEAQ
ncbi:MAG: SIMPL domain-containing protein [Clostridia bacterium]|nr:SIMPL domain-containing protein [Clostridia bacterium]